MWIRIREGAEAQRRSKRSEDSATAESEGERDLLEKIPNSVSLCVTPCTFVVKENRQGAGGREQREEKKKWR